jgi:hypothetical protein
MSRSSAASSCASSHPGAGPSRARSRTRRSTWEARAADFCDGWFPRGRNAERLLPGLAELKELATKAGRDMRTITTSVFGAAPDPALLDRWDSAGITRAILRLPSEGRDKILPLLDQWAKLITR